MAVTGPNLDGGPVQLSPIREQARRALVDALDQRRGKKVLVLEPSVSAFLGIIAEVALLKEHGVEQLFHLGTEPLTEVTAKSVIYLVRTRIEVAQMVARSIKEGIRLGCQVEYQVLFIPRKSLVCERIFHEEGVFGDVTLSAVDLQMIPVDEDVLSLEIDNSLQEVLLDGDRSSLFSTAQAIMRLQRMLGVIPYLAGKGPSAVLVRDMLIRMHTENGAGDLSSATAGIDLCIMIDRRTDLTTPMMTQLTYEGLTDEVLGIRNGFVTFDMQGQKQKMPLNGSDRVFRELRDGPFGAVGPWLADRTKGLQNEYQDTRSGDRSLAELKDFASQLRNLPSITRHIHLAELLTKAIAAASFRQRIRTEQELIDGNAADLACETVQDMMYQGAAVQTVLRLLCLISLTHGGLPKRQWDPLRKELLQHYGHQHLLTLTALYNAGLLRSSAGVKNVFPSIKKSLKLLVADLDERNADDVAYTYAGYAPVSIRLIERLLAQGSWLFLEDVLRQLPGAHFLQHQTLDAQGAPVAPSVQKLPSGTASEPQVVLVVFVGGVTYAEINALRFLQGRPGATVRFLVLTTRVFNGTQLIDGFMEDVVKQMSAQAALVQ